MRRLRVMVVDDSGLTVKKMVKLLEELGHEVAAVATTGRQAVADYPTVAPDMVAMDITMPELNGIEATRLIMDADPEARIIIVTSHGQEQMVMDAIEAGAKGYILKPVKLEKLRETLETVAEKYLP
ncbi:response regulator receiver protein [Solidesulfovibrio fructosivorans JJ]]|uniref:Response regulator receiver protein n=1 Tax=Solidesulfovibrio fructosivorans JJ] TaxID=596151 RepID=E1JTZ9_SOLFR|nr:response regulator [Solidesulfovibrio fructosivorans]EFL52278.1 response regulator receiver protein [Solidesulfovibrio fructosivorans JJ]]